MSLMESLKDPVYSLPSELSEQSRVSEKVKVVFARFMRKKESDHAASACSWQ